MIILVKVNQLFNANNNNLIAAAYRAWALGGLLGDEEFRNRYKYLVAYAEGEVVGTFCIHGIAEDHEMAGNRRKVRFQLTPTSEECDSVLRQIIQDLKNSGSTKIQKTMSSCYINATEDLVDNGVEFDDIVCECELNSIPLLNADEISYEI